MPSGLPPLSFGQVHFQFWGCLVCFSVSSFIIEIPVLNASVDSDQTPRFAVSDLGLHCLSMSLFMGRQP